VVGVVDRFRPTANSTTVSWPGGPAGDAALPFVGFFLLTGGREATRTFRLREEPIIGFEFD
jgi:hypothetical protein